MDPFDDAQEFGRRVRAVRGYLGLGRSEFAKLLGLRGDSTIDRYERGQLGKMRNNADGRRALAEEIIRKTKAPRSLFDLSEPGEATAAAILQRLEELEHSVAGLHADVQVVQLDLADARKQTGIPEYAEGVTGG